MTPNKKIRIPAKSDGIKIDQALHDLGAHESRRQIKRWIDNGQVSIGTRKIRFSSFKVRAGEVIEILVSEKAAEPKPNLQYVPKLSQLILFEEENTLVVNKPPHVLSQATGKSKEWDIIRLLRKSYEQAGREAPKEIIPCHRLDKETSGVLVLATSKAQADWIMSQFKDRLVKKTYEAITMGIPKQEKWETKCFLSAIDPKTGDVKPVRSGGKTAITKFQLLRANKAQNIAQVECQPHTGRSHQIRVHLQMAECPILGDKRYTEKAPKVSSELRQLGLAHHMLHAKCLQISLKPEEPAREFTADYPESFRKILKLL